MSSRDATRVLLALGLGLFVACSRERDEAIVQIDLRTPFLFANMACWNPAFNRPPEEQIRFVTMVRAGMGSLAA